MTLQQLRYIVRIADEGTLSTAAKKCYISQPTLTSAVKELEKEFNITVFNRTNKGVTLTAQGEEFIGYARQIIEQTSLMEERYKNIDSVKHRFCISAQHYSFAVEAFVELLKVYGGNEYDFRIRETQTYEIIQDVANLKSEVGILYTNTFNKDVIYKAVKENDLEFTALFTAAPHIFISRSNPLAKKEKVTPGDLEPFVRLSYEQGEHNAFYFSEEIQSTLLSKKDIRVRDRATLFNLLIGLNGYTVCSGIINEKLNGENIIAVPLDVDDYMQIGYITNKKVSPGYFGKLYIELLKKHSAEWKIK